MHTRLKFVETVDPVVPAVPSDRVQHEDTLLAGRAAAFLTATAFLTIAFATVVSTASRSTRAGAILQAAIICVGLFLSYLFLAMGKRSAIAVGFWRKYAEYSDHEEGRLFEFFRYGSVPLPDGQRITQHHERDGRTVWNAVPWSWAVGPNDAVGVLIPAGIGSFWVLLSFTVEWGAIPWVALPGLPSPLAPESFGGLCVFAVSAVFFIWMWVTWPDRPALERGGPLLAVLGRGVQYVGGEWLPSPDTVMCTRDVSGKPRFRPIPTEEDRESENWVVGGGQLNVEAAAVILDRESMPCVLGYAHPAEYLKGWDIASESVPMSETLRRIVPRPLLIFPYTGGGSGPSNTEVEVRNVMRLAKSKGYTEVVFLTIEPHMARVNLFARRHRLVAFRAVSSEGTLLTQEQHKLRIERLRASRAYRNTLADEKAGLDRAGEAAVTGTGPAR